MESVLLKLRVHPRNFCDEELIVNIDTLAKEEKFQLNTGDIIEICTPEEKDAADKTKHLLLQVKAVPQDVQTKGVHLSISQDLSQAFNLVGGKKVSVRRVDREEVGLDLMELRFKDQCLTRSDMWRFTCSLFSKCVYTHMKLEFSGMRAQVYDLWSHGENVSCGTIVKTTRVVFRSASAQVFLYIQMSSEMWDFDLSGDLYFDKAVNCFLKELFQRWKDEGCNHEVTLVFFWRVYYKNQSLDMLPPSARSNIQEDKRGMLYEDFYKVIVEGECVQDWSSKMVEIKRSFIQLPDLLHSTRGKDAKVSSAAEGNVLEAINLAVNVYEKHYVDCNFLMTGQQVVIVTAGTGAFQVDHELTRLTKERIIDGAIGADLICLTQQPPHAVPLFKFHSRDSTGYYHIPHWINYSFYNPTHPWGHVRFQPRLQLSDHLVNAHLNRGERRTKGTTLYNPFSVSTSTTIDSKLLSHRIDYDEHDAAIFTSTRQKGKVTSLMPVMIPSSKSAKLLVRHHSHDSSAESESSRVTFGIGTPPDDDDPFEVPDRVEGTSPKSPKGGIDIRSRRSSKDAAFSTSLRVARTRFRSDTLDDRRSVDKLDPSGLTAHPAPVVGSSEARRQFYLPSSHPPSTTEKKQMAFINPFDPQKVHTEISAYHRRWMHAFPRDKKGYAFQPHHATIQESPKETDERNESSSDSMSIGDEEKLMPERDGMGSGINVGSHSSGLCMRTLSSTVQSASRQSLKLRARFDSRASGVEARQGSLMTKAYSSLDSFSSQQRQSSLFSFGKPSFEVNPKVVEDFASVQRTGLDWKSVTLPACLPITTDFFPSEAILNRDYFENPTELVVSSVGSATGEATGEKTTVPWRTDHQHVNTFQVFREMISQRISQGFQLVFDLDSRGLGQNSVFSLDEALREMQNTIKSAKRHRRQETIVVKMSLGRFFQKIELTYPDMLISRYRAKNHPAPAPISYSYQLWSCSRDRSETMHSDFYHTKVEEYNWNYLDQHVCGYPDFEMLGESQKYWRCRYLLLPSSTPCLPPLCSQQERVRWENHLISNFVRFMEFLNHIKRGHQPQPSLRRHMSLPGGHTPSSLLHYFHPDSHSAVTSPVSHQLADIGENIEEKPTSQNPDAAPKPTGSPQAVRSPRHVASPKPSRPKSPAETGEKGSENRTRGERSRDRGRRERGGEGGQPHELDTRARGIEPKLDLKSKPSGSTSKPLLSPVRKVKSRDDLLQFQWEGENERPKSPHARLKTTSPRLSQRRGGREHTKRKLREATTDARESTSARRGPFKMVDSFPVHIHPPTPTHQAETSSALESSLDNPGLSTGIESPGPSSPSPEPPLTNTSPLKQILKALGDPDNGVEFLGPQRGLREGCFIAMDAVSWLKENVEGVGSRREATRIMNALVEEQLVMHASGDANIPLLDGYFIYYIPSNKEDCMETTTERVDRSFLIIDNVDFDAFSKYWFEVAIRFPTHSPYVQSTPLPAFAATPSPSYSPTSSLQQSSTFYMEFEPKKAHIALPPSMVRRYVELNPDPQSRSDRPEWCFVHYDHTYHPTRAFQLEFQWMVATVTLFYQLIQRWLHMASMCGFNLVAVPTLQSFSLSQEQRGTHPFRRQLFIPLSLPTEVARRWKDSDTFILTDNLQTLLSAITNKFGFLLDSSCILPDSNVLSPHYDSHDFLPSRLYVHHSGCALVQPMCEVTEEQRSGRQTPEEDPAKIVLRSSNPLKSSTPLASPSKKSPSKKSPPGKKSPSKKSPPGKKSPGKKSPDSSGSRTIVVVDMKCGFYWYRNFLLPKQKNLPSSMLVQYDSVLKDLKELCTNHDGKLLALCEQVFRENFM